MSFSVLKKQRVSILVIFAESCKLFAKHRQWFIYYWLSIELPLILLHYLPEDLWEFWMQNQILFGEYDEAIKFFLGFFSRLFSIGFRISLDIATFPFTALPLAIFIHSAIQGHPLSYQQSLKRVIKKIKPAICTQILNLLIWLVIILILALIFLPVNARLLPWMGVSLNDPVVVVTDRILAVMFTNLALLGAILTPITFLLSFFPFAIALHDASGLAAFRYSIRIIRFAPIRIIASCLLGMIFPALISQYAIDLPLNRINDELLLWGAVDLKPITRSLIITFIYFLTDINQVLIFLNTDYLMAKREAKSSVSLS